MATGRLLLRATSWRWAIFIAMLAFVGNSVATTVIPPTFDELVEDAESVFEGTVISSQSKWVGKAEKRRIKTYYTFEVNELLKGDIPSPYILEVLGGTVDADTLHVDGAPKFEIGDKVILFVTNNGAQFVPLVGIMHGHYKIEKDADTQHESIVKHDGAVLQSTEEIGVSAGPKLLRPPNNASPALTPKIFKNLIRDKLKNLNR